MKKRNTFILGSIFILVVSLLVFKKDQIKAYGIAYEVFIPMVVKPIPLPTATPTPTPTVTPTPTTTPRPTWCDDAYPTVCIASPPPDLNCNDIPYTNFQVLPPDPHHFDLDNDGIGCESN